jgi:hypothetical protein
MNVVIRNILRIAVNLDIGRAVIKYSLISLKTVDYIYDLNIVMDYVRT